MHNLLSIHIHIIKYNTSVGNCQMYSKYFSKLFDLTLWANAHFRKEKVGAENAGKYFCNIYIKVALWRIFLTITFGCDIMNKNPCVG